MDKSDGFTQASVERINESIRVFLLDCPWFPVTTRTDTIGTGTAFNAQEQYFEDIEEAINSPVDFPRQIDGYQNTLKIC